MSIIKIEDIAHVRFRAPDLDAMRVFLEDFGMSAAASEGILYMRGAGTSPFFHSTEEGEPGFAALGLRAKSIADLEKLAASEGVRVEDLDAPGGGKVVRLEDPDGQLLEIVAGQDEVEVGDIAERPPVNSVRGHPRASETVRLEQGPSHVVRLGHCALNVSNLEDALKWYQGRLGFIISDRVELEPGVVIGAFLRCDRDATPTDHHTLFLVESPTGTGFNHAAYEVEGFDDLMLGHQHLKAAERHQEWGVGRHILGSQIFDYWRDPWGHTLEHWTDGDLFTASDPTTSADLNALAGVQWGPALPPTFI